MPPGCGRNQIRERTIETPVTRSPRTSNDATRGNESPQTGPLTSSKEEDTPTPLFGSVKEGRPQKRIYFEPQNDKCRWLLYMRNLPDKPNAGADRVTVGPKTFKTWGNGVLPTKVLFLRTLGAKIPPHPEGRSAIPTVETRNVGSMKAVWLGLAMDPQFGSNGYRSFTKPYRRKTALVRLPLLQGGQSASRMPGFGPKSLRPITTTAAALAFGPDGGTCSRKRFWCAMTKINHILPWAQKLRLADHDGRCETDSLTPALYQDGNDTLAPSGCTFVKKRGMGRVGQHTSCLDHMETTAILPTNCDISRSLKRLRELRLNTKVGLQEAAWRMLHKQPGPGRGGTPEGPDCLRRLEKAARNPEAST
ncbi:hypothetical protein FQR65_LT19723 [Abscondita terminalis]|nr:hypothetical protein FQR65_LT19723 [Abscondita terminalis]